jgi:plastocyanin
MWSTPRLNVVIAATLLGLTGVSCGGDDGGNPMNPGGGGTADVTITIAVGSSNAGANAYSPDTAAVAVGQTVQWVNNDNMVHTATADAASFNTGNIGGSGGRSQLITITGSAGVRGYHCTVSGHNMQGWLNVTP